jgi:hypothetical protein
MNYVVAMTFMAIATLFAYTSSSARSIGATGDAVVTGIVAAGCLIVACSALFAT